MHLPIVVAVRFAFAMVRAGGALFSFWLAHMQKPVRIFFFRSDAFATRFISFLVNNTNAFV